jgi:hypothetical protein
MGLQMRQAAYVPDVLWEQYKKGEITHFQYDAKTDTAIGYYTDGTTVEFSTKVLPEHLADEREKALPVGYGVIICDTIIVSSPKFHRQIRNVG